MRIQLQFAGADRRKRMMIRPSRSAALENAKTGLRRKPLDAGQADGEQRIDVAKRPPATALWAPGVVVC